MKSKRTTYSENAVFLNRVVVFVPTLVLASYVAFSLFGDRHPQRRPQPAEGDRLVRLFEGPEGRSLREYRQWVFDHTADLDGVLTRADEALATTRPPELIHVAAGWREAIAGIDERREYEVVYRGYRLDRSAYRSREKAFLEPGRPDVYLRVYNRRAGDAEPEKLVFDGSTAVAEGWAKRWDATTGPRFRLSWARGDELRIELCEKDILGDDVVDSVASRDPLAILLLSRPVVTDHGHRVEFESNFGFGRLSSQP